MSLIFSNSQNRDKCQKFTPIDMIEIMLNLSGYTSDLIGRRVLENSFGSGNILKAIVIRYIEDCLAKNINKNEIAKNLANDICGVELDRELFNHCINELDMLAEVYNLPSVNWNLHNGDALTWDNKQTFDLIIGNPPYITYKDIDPVSKNHIRQAYNTCVAGKFDYCYAFIELGVNKLNQTGKLVQLVPSNIYKNVFAEELRRLLQPHISTILDFPSQNIFKVTLTSTSIFLYDKSSREEFIQYKNMTDNAELLIDRGSLSGKWMFANHSAVKGKRTRFGDVFNASIVIATLLNEAFVIDDEQLNKTEIEKELIRPAVSPRSIRYNRKEYIIFPYRYADNHLERLAAESFECDFPETARYLSGYIEKLNKRKSDKSTSWFEYGRTQALAHLNQEKLLLSTVVTNKVEIYHLDADTIPYSGIYITVKNIEYTLEDAKRILSDVEFEKYIKRIGISVNGKSVRITCKDINDYEFVGR